MAANEEKAALPEIPVPMVLQEIPANQVPPETPVRLTEHKKHHFAEKRNRILIKIKDLYSLDIMHPSCTSLFVIILFLEYLF